MAMADASGPVGPHVVPDPAPDSVDGPADDAAPALSWAEQETLDALRRLARAQSNLVALDAQAGPTGPRFDPEAVAHVEQVHAQLLDARTKASGRFTRAAARDRVEQLEMAERLALGDLGQPDYDTFRAVLASSLTTEPTVDAQVLAFARQELASARQAWLDLQAMPEPDPDPEPEVTGDVPPGPGTSPDVA
jgi:hypothetical protein